MKASSLSVERAKNIVDRCVITYLERRGRGEDELPPTQRLDSPAQTPDEKENPWRSIPVRQHTSPSSKAMLDGTLSGSPPDELQIDESLLGASAAIRDLSDFDQFTYTATEASPPKKRPTPHGPGPPGSSHRAQVPAKPSRQPPPPPLNTSDRKGSQRTQPILSPVAGADLTSRPPLARQLSAKEVERRQRYDRVKTVFRPL